MSAACSYNRTNIVIGELSDVMLMRECDIRDQAEARVEHAARGAEKEA